MERREFLKLIGLITGATVSCSGSKAPVEKLIPYLVPPEEEIIPGQAIYYPSTCTECPANCGILVKVLDKIPIKIEGNPKHPVNEGRLCIRGQSSIMRLYHPERLKNPMLKKDNKNFISINWKEAFEIIDKEIKNWRNQGYENIYISGRTTGVLAEIVKKFCEVYEIEKMDDYENFSHSALREAYKLVFDKRDIPKYKIGNCDLLITLGADIFETFVSPVYYAVEFAKAKQQKGMKWFHVEPHISLTGLKADKRIVIKTKSEIYFLIYLLRNMKVPEIKKIIRFLPNISDAEISQKTGCSLLELKELIDKFNTAKQPLLISGGIATSYSLGLEIGILTGIIQWFSGMIGNVVDFENSENYENISTPLLFKEVSEKMRNGKIGVSFISRINPIYDISSLYDFKEAFKKVKFKIGLADFLNETSKECNLILPLSHSLESWGDVKARKYLIGIIQPVIEPIFNTKSEGEILLNLIQRKSDEKESFQQYLFKRWKANYGENFIEYFLKEGFYEEIPSEEKITFNEEKLLPLLKNINLQEPPLGDVLIIKPSIRFYDGRSKIIPLLEEIPDPLTTISYGKWISLSEEEAFKYSLKDGDQLILLTDKISLQLPVKIQPAMPKNIFTINYDEIEGGYFRIDERTGEKELIVEIKKIEKTGKQEKLAVLSGLLLENEINQKKYTERLLPKSKEEPANKEKRSFYPLPHYKEYRWAMAIDLKLCIGCAACVAACYIENNVPIVGKEEHLKGREMSWIRIEPYYFPEERIRFIPMLCQQCDYAPCEPVCPVYATYHNPEGLNAQIYNRCVGTRYCSNNCPYKVRRFNWYDHKREFPLDKLINPEVYVRGKGVMEKCTFCIQRIRLARDKAKDENRKIRDGEVIPACAQTCPTGAIVFGNLLDKNSKIYKLAHSKRAYRIFEELGTSPAVYYLF